MRKYIRNLLIGALTLLIAGGSYLGLKETKNRKFTVRGELLSDRIQNLESFGEFYRVYIKTDNGKIVTYPILASTKEIKNLNEKLVSKEESGGQGDLVAINPNTGILSLDEVVLTPEHIKKID